MSISFLADFTTVVDVELILDTHAHTHNERGDPLSIENFATIQFVIYL